MASVKNDTGIIKENGAKSFISPNVNALTNATNKKTKIIARSTSNYDNETQYEKKNIINGTDRAMFLSSDRSDKSYKDYRSVETRLASVTE